MVLGAFTDQAYNLILMANDEARVLRSEAVAPEHLLLGWIATRAYGRCRASSGSRT